LARGPSGHFAAMMNGMRGSDMTATRAANPP
jgi:hypothetical protein